LNYPAIVSESSCSLPKLLQEQFQIKVMPHSVNINGQEYIEGINISDSDLRKLLHANTGRVTTSAVNPKLLAETFESILRQNRSVIFVGLPPRFSCTLQNAQIARQMCSIPERIFIYDGKCIGINLGKLAMAASQLAASGRSPDFIFSQLDQMRQRMAFTLWARDMSAIVNNGRANDLLSRFASIINIQPVLTLAPDGTPQLIRLTRTLAQGIDTMVDLVRARGMAPGEVLCIGHFEAPAAAAQLEARLRKQLGIEQIVVLEGGNLLYLHLGAGSVSISI
jgi:DegV family protein with EDD domain